MTYEDIIQYPSVIYKALTAFHDNQGVFRVF